MNGTQIGTCKIVRRYDDYIGWLICDIRGLEVEANDNDPVWSVS